LVTITAGSGIGKTTLVREIAHHLHIGGSRMGLIMLEESNKRTLQGLTGIFMSKNITVDRSEVDEDEITAAFDMLFGPDMPPLYLYDHWGSTDIDVICARIEYMVKALGVEYLILDHISILISGQSFGQNERTLIDMTMTKLRTLVQELNIGLLIVSHLRRPDGNQGHEDGAQVRLGQLRGSHSIAQLSDICISMAVDAEEPNSDIRHLHILKNRYTGQTGPAGTLNYNRDTGRLIEDVLAQLQPVEDEAEGDTDDDIS
jgi:twinkle protein